MNYKDDFSEELIEKILKDVKEMDQLVAKIHKEAVINEGLNQLLQEL